MLRWSWRVNYYGYQALGTDRYPPFTLADVPDYPARLHLTETGPPPRWLPLVAWLLAVPHVLLLGALSGAATWTVDAGDTSTSAPLGVVTVGVLIAGLGLLFAGRYPRGLHDLLVGVGRWNLRVLAYLTLLTPGHPPFRLDQGELEPDDPDGPAWVGDPATPADPAPAARGSAAGAVSALPDRAGRHRAGPPAQRALVLARTARQPAADRPAAPAVSAAPTRSRRIVETAERPRRGLSASHARITDRRTRTTRPAGGGPPAAGGPSPRGIGW